MEIDLNYYSLPDLGDTYKVPSMEMEMIRVKKGVFQRGANDSNYNERPQHRVHLTHDFYLGKYPVTQKQWVALKGNNPSYKKNNDSPVERVNWRDVRSFCNLLTETEIKSGNITDDLVYSLPTEAEWEYACKAGQETHPENGENIDDYAFSISNSDFKLHEVGKKKANNWGFFDMLGNVFEWVEDSSEYKDTEWYLKKEMNVLSPSYKDDVVNPNESKGNNKVAKGGCWFLKNKYCTPSYRYINPSDSRYFNIGFRIVLKRK